MSFALLNVFSLCPAAKPWVWNQMHASEAASLLEEILSEAETSVPAVFIK
jgi:hypothetical protein